MDRDVLRVYRRQGVDNNASSLIDGADFVDDKLCRAKDRLRLVIRSGMDDVPAWHHFDDNQI